ncbi:mucin-binding protein, partial [Lactobacillus crispatus]|uniref:mucin-binding protein n=1 Tax=Lactobacillus crispatus TaxID=47770 RepID=UPI003F8CFE45
LSYTASKVIDKVTGEVLETKWSANQDFKDVDSPSVKGYTSDKTVVSNKDVAHDAADITETVKYSADKQKAKITYIDDQTGKTIETKELEGVSNGHSDYSTSATIKSLENKGYVKVSDDTNGSEVVFDNDDAKDQAFTVHLSHGTITVTTENPGKPGEPINPGEGSANYPDGTDKTGLTDTVNRTITYVMSDGSKEP